MLSELSTEEDLCNSLGSAQLTPKCLDPRRVSYSHTNLADPAIQLPWQHRDKHETMTVYITLEPSSIYRAHESSDSSCENFAVVEVFLPCQQFDVRSNGILIYLNGIYSTMTVRFTRSPPTPTVSIK